MGRILSGPTAAVLGAAILAAGACTGSPGTISHPTGSSELVLRIETAGGFVPPSFLVGQIPQLSVFGDGRVIVLGPQIAIFPGPALPNLVTFRLSGDALQTLLENARAAGLLGDDAHYDYPFIADAPTTTFTVVAEGRRHVVAAYALSEAGLNDAQLDPDVRRARAALLAFEGRALDLRAWFSDEIVEPDSAFEFAALRVYVTVAAPTRPPGAEPTLAEWPLDVPLGDFGAPLTGLSEMRCGVVAGDDLATLLPDLQASNQWTLWGSEGETYYFTLRPLLPDESGCPTTI